MVNSTDFVCDIMTDLKQMMEVHCPDMVEAFEKQGKIDLP